jgi:chromosome segregation ATPase
MIREASPRAGFHPSIVLSAYVEPLVRGRRVAILGDATIGLPDELGQRGARLLHVYDPDAARVAEAIAKAPPARPHPVSYAVLSDDLGVRDGAFDAVVVPDLALFADPADVMRRARRLVSGSGVAVFVAPNAGAAGKRLVSGAGPQKAATLGYYELFDLVSLQFAKVKMIGQAPFVGYTVADFAPRGEPDVSVDTSLLASSEEPEHFIAIASDRPVHVEPYAVIELPWSDVAEALGAGAPAVDTAALAEAEARVKLLDDELGRLRAREIELAREAEARAPAAAALSARVSELERELEQKEARMREVEARAGDNHVRAERNANQIRDLDEELRRQRDRGTKLSKLLDDEKKARTKAEVELGMLRGGGNSRVDALTAELEAARARITELEADQAETRRRAPEQVAPDPKLVSRVAELEAAVNAALREAADAAALRDAAIERAKKAEARVERAATVESQLAADQRALAEMAERVGVAERRATESARRLAEVDRAATDAARRSAEASVRLLEMERRLADAEPRAARAAELEARVAEQTAKIAAQSAKIAEQEARIAEQAARIDALSAEVAAEHKKLAEVRDDSAALEAAASEIAALEASLLDRGRRIAQLERDLREAERVGKELLSELESLRGWNGTAAAATEGDELRARLDTLAAGAAKTEADLQAAAWRIAQLERELTDARREAREPSAVQIELEKALAAARDEVASLRRALGSAAS